MAWGAKTCIKCRPPKHGLSYTPEYRVWQTMRHRCTIDTNPAWDAYGGRGITVCARWLGSVEAFIEDMGPKPSPKHEIDRRDNDGGYWCGKCDECRALGRPANCRWATRSENDRNRRSNVLIEFRGEKRTVIEWCQLLGIPEGTIRHRLNKLEWPVERAFTAPIRRKAANGTVAKRCKRCRGRGRFSVRQGEHGWSWMTCDCPAGAELRRYERAS